MTAVRILKGWACEYGGFTNIIYAPTASKARYIDMLAISDCYPDIQFRDIRVKRAPEHDITLPGEHELVSKLSHEERGRILHAYGYRNRPRNPKDWGYRSHYCTEPRCPIMANMTGLGIFRGPYGVDDKGDTPGWVGAFWYLTDLGKEVALSMIPVEVA